MIFKRIAENLLMDISFHLFRIQKFILIYSCAFHATLLCSLGIFFCSLRLTSIRGIFDNRFRPFGQRKNSVQCVIILRSTYISLKDLELDSHLKVMKASHKTLATHISITIIIVFKCTNQYCMRAAQKVKKK